MSVYPDDRYVECEFASFDAVARYTCPLCGMTEDVRLDAWDVYWMLEMTLEHECPGCHEKLRLC
ncbi:MAG: hypothetical protein IKE22_13830 [Atopobiaceae bacterium]|nr:hypothetical protein [Atopobiaceae bacterium]